MCDLSASKMGSRDGNELGLRPSWVGPIVVACELLRHVGTLNKNRPKINQIAKRRVEFLKNFYTEFSSSIEFFKFL